MICSIQFLFQAEQAMRVLRFQEALTSISQKQVITLVSSIEYNA